MKTIIFTVTVHFRVIISRLVALGTSVASIGTADFMYRGVCAGGPADDDHFNIIFPFV